VPYKTSAAGESGRLPHRDRPREAELERALDAYEKVYNSSWKNPRADPHFIAAPGETPARNGWLRMGLIHIDGEPAAAQSGSCTRRGVDLQDRLRRALREAIQGTVLTSKLMQMSSRGQGHDRRLPTGRRLQEDVDVSTPGVLGHRRVQSAQSSRAGADHQTRRRAIRQAAGRGTKQTLGSKIAQATASRSSRD